MKPSFVALRDMLGLTHVLTPKEWMEQDKIIEKEEITDEAIELYVLGFLALALGMKGDEECLETY